MTIAEAQALVVAAKQELSAANKERRRAFDVAHDAGDRAAEAKEKFDRACSALIDAVLADKEPQNEAVSTG
jgi:hypothetical protein